MAYDARTYQRVSIGMKVRAIGRDRLFFRNETAARVRWSRAGGVSIEPTGRRAVAPMFKEADLRSDFDELAPVPYFPGRETLWFPSSEMGRAQVEVDENELLHPLAAGAEAYYRYATGDSVAIRLPDGRAIGLRELRVTARRPDFRAFVGSFWFDTGSGALVRAAYRSAAELDVWRFVDEERERELAQARERARTDTSKAARDALRAAEAEYRDDDVPRWVKGTMSPMRARISAITVEYGLHQGRFWLPRANVAEGDAQAGFLRIPFRLEERFRYEGVNGDARPVARPAALVGADTVLADTSGVVTAGVWIGGDDGEEGAARAQIRGLAQRGQLDSLALVYVARAQAERRRADSLRTGGDTTKARQALWRAGVAERRAALTRRQASDCRTGSTYYAGTRTRHDGALRVAVHLPCDTTRLATSPDLPPSIYEPGEELFGGADRDALVAALGDFGLQPGWMPQRPALRTGLDLVRFNRVEGLSVGGEATSVLGKGYTARALARLGVADLVPNGELALLRSNGQWTRRAAVYHRLAVANDDWGAPLSFGASLASALYGRDEGFYFRSWGAEVGATRDGVLGRATLGWRAFAERQRAATREMRRGALGADFLPNVEAPTVTALGAGLDAARSWGVDPAGLRLSTRARVEGAALDWARRALVVPDPRATQVPGGPRPTRVIDGRGARGYLRTMAEATLSRALGPLAASVTGAGGVMAGVGGDRDVLPAQRLFYLGGLQTVRGQFARPTNALGAVTGSGVRAGHVGDAFWLARTEVGLDGMAVRPTVFYDVGWAGPRADLARPGRPLSGVGAGASFLDGLFRVDLSRGIAPERRWRLDLSLEARF